MSPPLEDGPGSGFDASILSLQANLTQEGITVLTTAQMANEFLKAEEGPFAELKKLVEDHSVNNKKPSLNQIPSLHNVVDDIVSKLWGHTSPKMQGEIGNIFDAANITDDLTFQSMWSNCLKSPVA